MSKSPDIDATKVARGSIYLTLQNVVGTIIGVLGFAFLARAISTDEMGVIAGLLLLASLVPLLSEFGLNSSMLKHVSVLKGEGKDFSGVIFSAVVFRLSAGVVGGLVVFFLGSSISSLLFKSDVYMGIIGLLAVDLVFLSLSPVLNSVLLGAGKMRAISAYGIVMTATRWVSIVAFLLLGLGLNGVVIGWILGDVVHLCLLSVAVAALINCGFRARILGARIGEAVRRETLPMLKFAWPLYASSIVAFLYTWYDKAIVLASLPLADLGVYNTTYTAFSMLVVISTSLGASLLPYYGMAYGRKDHDAISYAIKRSSKYSMLIIFPLTMGLFAGSRQVLVLFAGNQYESGWILLAVFALFGLIFGLAPALNNILLIYGKTKTVLLLSIFPIFLSLAMLPLVWIIGLNGLAVIRGMGFLLSFVLTWFFVNKLVRVSLSKSDFAKTLMASVLMALVMIVLLQFFQSTYALVLIVGVSAVLYFALVRVFKILGNEDFILLKRVLGIKLGSLIEKILK